MLQFKVSYLIYMLHIHFIYFRKIPVYRLYGKWNKLLRCVSESDFQRYVHQKSDKKADASNDRSRKIFSKLNNLKMSSFLSVSIQEVSTKHGQ